MKYTLLFILAALAVQVSPAQISAKLIRYPDVSDSQITFVYGGDVWLVDKNGGTAVQMTESPGEESWPKFSPAGDEIAYTASYDGNEDVYVMPVKGGIPDRLTFQSHSDRTVDWHPDGNRVLFASNRSSGMTRVRQFYLVDRTGGMPEKLSVPYGELASFSADGSKLAYITKITENYPFKRYRGGLTSDILIYDFETGNVDRITTSTANDGKPVWAGKTVYFLSDRAANMRRNIWAFDTESKQLRQVTDFADFDISYISAGPSDMVFEMGGNLYLMDLSNEKYKVVEIHAVSDLTLEKPRAVDVHGSIRDMTLSPGGSRVIFEARGELFNVPAREGFTVNLSRSSGAFDRQPAWSPDGKSVAFWSDRLGEYEIYVQSADGKGDARQITRRGKGFGYTLYWSPDSRKLAFIDEKNDISILDVETGQTQIAGNTLWNIGHGGRYGYPIAWSADSKWIAFTQGLENANSAVFVYNLETATSKQATSGFYNDSYPVFSNDGKYLFYLTNRTFNASYSDMEDGTWIYPNSTRIAALALVGDATYLLEPENDEVEISEDKDDEDVNGKEESTGDGAEETRDQEKEDTMEEAAEKSGDDDVNVVIDFDELESRITLLPPDAGNFGGMASIDDKLVYLRRPNTGSGDRSSELRFYDFKEREDKEIISDVGLFKVSADGKKILVQSSGKYGVVDVKPMQKIDDAVPTGDMSMNLVPKEEWRQIFMDTWRRHRDFFYDPNMHGVDWEQLREQYGALIDDARSRWDVANIQSDLAAELSAGHTYTFGGDNESYKFVETGYLGVDWGQSDLGYRIERIIRPAAWDTEVRSPFDRPGTKVKEGYYIHSVNGFPIESGRDPYASFEGLGGKTVKLEVSENGDTDQTEEVLVKCLSQGEELRLRYLEWIEKQRTMVDELSDGKLGYVYMSNTAGQGQLELVKMFYGQLDKEGFIIDERFNGGGQLADRFLELLTRPVVYNLHWRHGRDHTWPVKTNTGPMGMLINGWAGSGGDGLPWAFQELKAGPIVGERTVGILVGPATGHELIDGGGITVPGARLYDNDGHWFWEGQGVAPDIEVWDDPNLLMQGRDPQLERVVSEVLNMIDGDRPRMTPAPPAEDRTARKMGGTQD